MSPTNIDNIKVVLGFFIWFLTHERVVGRSNVLRPPLFIFWALKEELSPPIPISILSNCHYIGSHIVHSKKKSSHLVQFGYFQSKS